MEPELCEECDSHYAMSLEKIIDNRGECSLAWRCESCGHPHLVDLNEDISTGI